MVRPLCVTCCLVWFRWFGRGPSGGTLRPRMAVREPHLVAAGVIVAAMVLVAAAAEVAAAVPVVPMEVVKLVSSRARSKCRAQALPQWAVLTLSACSSSSSVACRA
jgi:hypothetical protein